ncbi:MAG: serine hydrolase [Planctomycetes bacterium]|nr:serine hydrolase [Planctomycetota bacterium]
MLGTAAAQPTSVTEKVDALADRYLKDGLAVGFVIGFIADGKTWSKGYGRVGGDHDEAPTDRTIYEIGSITKTFTGILLACAVERKEVAVDDPVQKHLPKKVRLPQRGERPIRLVDLVTHTSGLPRMPHNFRPKDPRNPFADYDTALLHAALPKIKLASDAGKTYAYSNFGSGLLGHLLCGKAGAKDYDALLLARVTGPLGLKDTRCRLNDAMRERFAPALARGGRKRLAWDFDALAGCGAIRSTAADMLVYARANLDPKGTKLGPALEAAQRVRYDQGPGKTAVALGWHRVPNGKSLWHNGGTGGFRSFLGFDRARGRAVVILANTTSRKVDALAREVMKALE